MIVCEDRRMKIKRKMVGIFEILSLLTVEAKTERQLKLKSRFFFVDDFHFFNTHYPPAFLQKRYFYNTTRM